MCGFSAQFFDNQPEIECNSFFILIMSLPFFAGASVVLILVHASMMAPPTSHKMVDEEMGLVMEEVTIS